MVKKYYYSKKFKFGVLAFFALQCLVFASYIKLDTGMALIEYFLMLLMALVFIFTCAMFFPFLVITNERLRPNMLLYIRTFTWKDIEYVRSFTVKQGKRFTEIYEIKIRKHLLSRLRFAPSIINDANELFEYITSNLPEERRSFPLEFKNQSEILHGLNLKNPTAPLTYREYEFSPEYIRKGKQTFQWKNIRTVLYADDVIIGYGSTDIIFETDGREKEAISIEPKEPSKYHETLRYICIYASEAYIDPQIVNVLKLSPQSVKRENCGLALFVLSLFILMVNFGSFLIQEFPPLPKTFFVLSVVATIGSFLVFAIFKPSNDRTAKLKYLVPLASVASGMITALLLI